MINFQMPFKLMQKGSKGSVILPGLQPYTQSLHQTFTMYIPSSILEPEFQQTGTSLFSSKAHFYIGSFLHVFSMFDNTIKWTLLMQENFWNILLLVGEYLALLIHQCCTRTVLCVKLELLLSNV